MLIAMLAKEEPDGLLVCFDEGEETFRHEAAEDYKEGRAETPDDFYDQIPRVIELIDSFGMTHVSDPKYEADDLICAYAREAEEKGIKVTIVSGDRDLLQLASEKITVVIPHKGYQQAEYLGPEGVVEKIGVRPDQVASYKGLCGDQSDNLPGVNGIGPKGASELLNKYETLEGIYENLDEIRPKVREKLERDKEQAFFCEKMATLVCDFKLPASLKDLDVSKLPTESIVSFFKEMEFTLLLKRLQQMLISDYGKERLEEIEVGSGDLEDNRKKQLSLF